MVAYKLNAEQQQRAPKSKQHVLLLEFFWLIARSWFEKGGQSSGGEDMSPDLVGASFSLAA